MFSIKFDKHAGAEFTAQEKQIITRSARQVAALSKIARTFPSNEMVDWFGVGADSDDNLKNNIRRMNTVIQDPARAVTFVNAVRLGLKVSYDPENALAAPVLQPVGYKPPKNERGAFVGLAYPMDNTDVAKPLTSAHVGSGMRIYLGRDYSQLSPQSAERPQAIYHELTHKVLATNDHDYGVLDCRNLAITSPDRARRNADNYGYFLISIPGWV